MRAGRRAGIVVTGLTALLVAACGQASPEQELADRVDAVTRQANDRDADGLRDAALSLADTVSAQREDGTLSAASAQKLLTLATTLRERADVLDPDVQARRKAEQAAERARQDADTERTAREQAEQRAAEQTAQAERDRQQAAADADQARQAAEEKARQAAQEKGRQGGEQAPQDAEKQAEDAAKQAEDAAKQAEKAAEDAADG